MESKPPLDLKQLSEMQRSFDREMGWNTYEKCHSPDEILDFMEHFVCVMVEELGEIARARKEFLRDKQKFDAQALKHEIVDLFVYLMQASMALNMDLEKEYKKKMRTFKTRFQTKKKQDTARNEPNVAPHKNSGGSHIIG